MLTHLESRIQLLSLKRLFASSEVVKALKIFFVGNWEQNIRNIFVEIPNSSPISFFYNPFPRILFRWATQKHLPRDWLSHERRLSKQSPTVAGQDDKSCTTTDPKELEEDFWVEQLQNSKATFFPSSAYTLGK